MALTATIRVREDDHLWLMQNRGVGSVPDKIHELRVEREAMEARVRQLEKEVEELKAKNGGR